MFTLWANREFRTFASVIGDEKPLSKALDETIEYLKVEAGVIEKARIKVCAVWDTVSSLGLPTLKLSPRPLSFVGKKVPSAVDYAFQALALNESRRSYKPRIWEAAEDPESTTFKQCWFLGCHSDVGGGNPDIGLAVIPFFWIITQLKATADIAFNGNELLNLSDHGYWDWEKKLKESFRSHRKKLKFEGNISTQGK